MTTGYVLDVARASWLKFCVGVAGSIGRILGDLLASYGTSPAGVLGFFQFSTH